MAIFLTIVLSVPLIGLLWLWWADRRLRAARAKGWMRLLLAGMVVGNVLGFAALILTRVLRWDVDVPLVVLVSTAVWHVVVLPIALLLAVVLLGGELAVWVAGKVGNRERGAGNGERQGESIQGATAGAPDSLGSVRNAGQGEGLTRRQVLTAGVLGAPVMMQIAGASVGMSQLDHFRVREIVVRLPQLPVDFEGFVIAHVTDTHVGRFTSGATLTAIAEAVNSLKADCVVHTGDLINDSLEDLPAAKAMLAKFRSVHGTFLVEGNHDLFESRTRFVQGLQTQEMWDAGLRVLLNSGATIERGSGKLQLLGMRWGNAKTEDIRTDRAAGAMLNEHAAEIDRVRDARAFSVLLAHHPHAFDRAIARAIPLTLAGHTHGGQINVLPGVGPATMSYRYISGLYERVSASGERVACIVGNGTGNWFPLRVQAPAEIVRVVLRRS